MYTTHTVKTRTISFFSSSLRCVVSRRYTQRSSRPRTHFFRYRARSRRVEFVFLIHNIVFYPIHNIQYCVVYCTVSVYFLSHSFIDLETPRRSPCISGVNKLPSRTTTIPTLVTTIISLLLAAARSCPTPQRLCHGRHGGSCLFSRVCHHIGRICRHFCCVAKRFSK